MQILGIKDKLKVLLPEWAHINPIYRAYVVCRKISGKYTDSLVSRLYSLLLAVNFKRAYIYHKIGVVAAERVYVELAKGNDDRAMALSDKAIDCYLRAIDCDKRFIQSYRWLCYQYLLRFRLDDVRSTYQRLHEIRNEIEIELQFDELGVRFIPSIIFSGNYGYHIHLASHLKSKLLGLMPPHQSVVLLPPDFKASNTWLFDHWKQYVYFVTCNSAEHQSLAEIAPILEDDIASYNVAEGRALWVNEAIGLISRHWEAEGRGPLLELSAEDFELGREELEKVGVPRDAWFVALHVRDPGFKTADANSADIWDGHRNADIRSYWKAVQTVVDRGGWVLRMGDPHMAPIEDMEHIVDYAHSEIRSDFMDVFCCAACRMFIGTNAGLQGLAEVFDVPMALTNYVSMTARPRSSKQIVIFKLLRSIKDNRLLTFEEGMRSPLGEVIAAPQYRLLGVEWVDNTEDEIDDAVVEMLDRLEGKVVYSDEDEVLQDRFNELHGKYSNWGGLGRVSREFLRKYEHLC